MRSSPWSATRPAKKKDKAERAKQKSAETATRKGIGKHTAQALFVSTLATDQFFSVDAKHEVAIIESDYSDQVGVTYFEKGY